MKKVLLHICCGICSSWAIEKLQQDGFCVTGFFYNPNIFPQEEYVRRLGVAEAVSEAFKIRLEKGEYDPDRWRDLAKGLEGAPEGGARCQVCFGMRLQKTREKAAESGCGYFTTTLSISPHKNSPLINQIGKSIDSASFLAYDFKKEAGFQKATRYSKEHDLYRQNYCGCEFSKDQSGANRAKS